MFIALLAEFIRSSGGAECALGEGKHFAPLELQEFVKARCYKHLVPPGPKTQAIDSLFCADSVLLRPSMFLIMSIIFCLRVFSVRRASSRVIKSEDLDVIVASHARR